MLFGSALAVSTAWRIGRPRKRSSSFAAMRVEDTTGDPVYGASLANTWKWLKSKATGDVFDFGVSAVRRQPKGSSWFRLNAPAEDAPVLFPAHLDCWVQTNPRPTPEPDPAWFLHGPKKPGEPDVQIVFRNDIRCDWSNEEIIRLWKVLNPNATTEEQDTSVEEKRSDLWGEIVALCPPSSSEAATVPIGVFRKWLAAESIEDPTGDAEGDISDPENDNEGTAGRFALCWRGPEKSTMISDPKEINPAKAYAIPNKVYVIPCSAPDVSSLCDFIGEIPSDYAPEAFQRSRDKALLRLPDLNIPEGTERAEKVAL